MTRAVYLRALADAMGRPSQGDPTVAIQSLLTLDAAYFLGPWLPARTHARLVRRWAATLDGIGDLSVPAGEPAASQLAQHARELAAAFGPSAWTARIAALTEPIVPRAPADWAAGVRPALDAARDGKALTEELIDALLLAHARRRLGEITHPTGDENVPGPTPAWSRRLARRAAASENGRAVQAAEALLAELAYGGHLP